MSNRIEYYEQDGRIGVRYSNMDVFIDCHLKDFGPRDLGLIPEDIQSAGKASIRHYAVNLCSEDLKKLKSKHSEQVAKSNRARRGLNLELTVLYKNMVELKGRIMNAGEDSWKVIVKLEHPYKVTSQPYAHPTCFASSMAGHRTFDLKTGELTDWAIQDAKQTLIAYYEEASKRDKHPEAMQLLDELNNLNED